MKYLKEALIFLLHLIEILIFPPCCLVCGRLEETILCSKCKQQIEQEYHFQIEEKEEEQYFFEKHVYFFKYRGLIRMLILAYKFYDKAYLYQLFSDIMKKHKKMCGLFKKYDIIMPVPIHTKRKRQRGYNQSELMAKEIAKQFPNLKMESQVIMKTTNNVAQSTLCKAERIENVKNVYKIQNKEKIKGKAIIVLDDIYTTGSTLKEISKILKENGAKKIMVLTIAKD